MWPGHIEVLKSGPLSLQPGLNLDPSRPDPQPGLLYLRHLCTDTCKRKAVVVSGSQKQSTYYRTIVKQKILKDHVDMIIMPFTENHKGFSLLGA